VSDLLPPCTDEDPELFFPVGTSGPAMAQAAAAKAVCFRCPGERRAACLDQALQQRLTDGVWGGLTEQERTGMYPESHPVRDRPDMDEAVRKQFNMSVERAAKELGIPAEAVRASRRRLAARKSVAA
jgi:WhiB family redox-sensing transcriptional regulator